MSALRSFSDRPFIANSGKAYRCWKVHVQKDPETIHKSLSYMTFDVRGLYAIKLQSRFTDGSVVRRKHISRIWEMQFHHKKVEIVITRPLLSIVKRLYNHHRAEHTMQCKRLRRKSLLIKTSGGNISHPSHMHRTRSLILCDQVQRCLARGQQLARLRWDRSYEC